MPNFPDNFVAVGDAVCSLNPTFGQGMTQLTLHVMAIDEAFRNHLTKFPYHDFTGLSIQIQKKVANISSVFWNLVAPEDLAWKTTVGPRSAAMEFKRSFSEHLIKQMFASVEGTALFLKVNHGLVGPQAFLHPKILFPVLKHMLQDWLKKKFSS